MHPSLECSLIWKNWSSLSPGFYGRGWNSVNPGPDSWLKVGIYFLFFFPRAGCRGAVTSALAITVQLEGVGTVSLVVLM